MLRTFTILQAIDMNGAEIEGIPDPNGYWGEFKASYPQTAAAKAFSSIIEYLRRYDQWYNIEIDGEFSLVLILLELNTDEPAKPLIYYAYREPAIQGKRSVASKDGRVRQHMWRSRAIPMRDGETVEEAMVRYQSRRKVAQNRKESLANLKWRPT